jgi:amino acid transporter
VHDRSPDRDQDAEQLRALGYVSHFDRSMSLWENFALGFTFLSPVARVYTIFATTFAAGGPPMWRTYLLVGLGQLLVCLVFGEFVSQFPISGGIYPRARRLFGKRWARMAGWIYGWALFITLAAEGTAVALYSVVGGGHTWPGGQGLPRIIFGKTSRDFNANEVIWEFFKVHALPAPAN